MALDRDALRRGLRICTWEGVTAQLHLSVVSSAVLTGLALRLGAGELALGLLGALPIACRPLQLLSAVMLDRGVDHKPIFTWGALIHRAVWIVPALLLLWSLGDDVRLGLLVAVTALSYAAAAPTENAWVSWAADYVPAGIRGRYFGLRNPLLYAVGQTAALGAALCVDNLGPDNEEISHLLVFGAAVLSGLISVWLLSRYPAPRRRNSPGFKLWGGLKSALANSNLRRFLVAAGLWNIAVGIGGPFFAPHALDYLCFDYTTFQLYGILWTVATLLTNRFWGRVLDRFGSRAILVVAGIALGVFPLIWALTGPELTWPLWPEALASGACWAAFNLALFAAPLGIARRETRPYAIAAVAVVTGVGYLLGSTLGGLAAEGVGGTRPLVGDWLTGYQLVFILSGLARIGAACFFTRLRDPGGDHLRPLVGHLAEVGFKRPLSWLRGLFRRTE